MWKCPNCETLNDDDICVVCGEKRPINKNQTVVSTKNESKKSASEKRPYTTILKKYGIVAAVIVALLGVGTYFVANFTASKNNAIDNNAIIGSDTINKNGLSDTDEQYATVVNTSSSDPNVVDANTKSSGNANNLGADPEVVPEYPANNNTTIKTPSASNESKISKPTTTPKVENKTSNESVVKSATTQSKENSKSVQNKATYTPPVSTPKNSANGSTNDNSPTNVVHAGDQHYKSEGTPSDDTTKEHSNGSTKVTIKDQTLEDSGNGTHTIRGDFEDKGNSSDASDDNIYIPPKKENVPAPNISFGGGGQIVDAGNSDSGVYIPPKNEDMDAPDIAQ